MNKHRPKEGRLSFAGVSFLTLSAVILLTAGVIHAWIKNSHVEVMRDIDKTEQRIGDHEDAINSLQVKIDKKLNIYQLRDDLEQAGSQLVLVPPSSIEVITPYLPDRRQARVDPRPLPIAQSRP